MLPKHAFRSALVLFLIAGMVLAACAPAPAQPAATEAPSATEPPAPPAAKKVATFIFTQEFDTLNPLYTNMWFSQITHQIWNCWAWEFDEQNNPRPVLVKEMPSEDNGGISPDGKVITLKLREDLVWSDGDPLTAEDFLFTYNMNMAPNNVVASRSPYDLMESVQTPDERTVVITFKEPYAPWLGTLWKGILPAHVLKPVFDQNGTIDNAEWNRAPKVGCGPFVFQEWESGSFARFTANEQYWQGRPILDEIFIRFVPDDASQIAALKAKDGDIGTFFAYSDVPDLEASGIKVVKAFSGYNEVLYFYMDPEKGHPALQDARVRKAIALATDRGALVNDLLLGLTKPAATQWDNTPYVDPSIQPWPFDPEQAKALLDEAGWVDSNGDGVRDKDGVELTLDYGTTTREVRRDTQAVFKDQLAAVGIKVELFNYDSDIYFAGYQDGGPAATGQLDIFEYSTTTNFPDPDTADWLCSEIPSDENPAGTNWSALCDTELDELFKLQATQVDFNDRQQTFFKISKRIFENAFLIGVWQDPDLFGISSRLLNVKISGVTPFFNIMEWDVTQ